MVKHLKIVVLQDFDEGISQTGNFHFFLNLFNQNDRIDVCPDVVQQAGYKTCQQKQIFCSRLHHCDRRIETIDDKPRGLKVKLIYF